MPISKNFKVISDSKTEDANLQEEIIATPEELKKLEETLDTFFTGVKTLLREGAVLIDEERNNHEERSNLTLEEEFLTNPTPQNKGTSLYLLALKTLPKKTAEAFKAKINGLKMNENFEFFFEMNENFELKEKIEKIISRELQNYSRDLPQIMLERSSKLQLLTQVRPDIKKYLENIKKEK